MNLMNLRMKFCYLYLYQFLYDFFMITQIELEEYIYSVCACARMLIKVRDVPTSYISLLFATPSPTSSVVITEQLSQIAYNVSS